MDEKTGKRPSTLEEGEDLLFYWQIKKKSLEAYAQRIDPYEDGLLDMVVNDILDARDEIERLQLKVLAWRAEKSIEVLLRGRGTPQ